MSDHDVIVIGSGAGGGTLVHRLAPSGKRILLLERGDWLPREPQNWRSEDVFVENRYVSPDTSAGAADHETLIEVLIVFGVAVVLVLPALGLLYVLSQRSVLEEEGG